MPDSTDTGAGATQTAQPDRASLEMSVYANMVDDAIPTTRDWKATDGLDQPLDPATLMRPPEAKPAVKPVEVEAEPKTDPKQGISDGQSPGKTDVAEDGEEDRDILAARLKSAQREFHARTTENSELKKSHASVMSELDSLKKELDTLKQEKGKSSGSETLNLDEYQLSPDQREYLNDILEDPDGKETIEKIVKTLKPQKASDAPKKEEPAANVDDEGPGSPKATIFAQDMDEIRPDWRKTINSDEFKAYSASHQATVEAILEKYDKFDTVGLLKVFKQFDLHISQNQGAPSRKAADAIPDGRRGTMPGSSGPNSKSRDQLEKEALKGMP